ncbi:hypothetical protein ANANG_G00101480 [Anguilla anguilla]|uniref:Uncharacterized protein n=1 Tax=Anguilla anguilla TaxID=7936 RepID=A0A9D3MJA7_ANGAN|nr:hypothetical protein ANANG_G00101480 [Anguilla anguilla]
MAGFRCTGIRLFNPAIFTDAEPEPEPAAAPGGHGGSSQVQQVEVNTTPAGPRKTHTIQRKRRATAILTDTPVKRALEEEKTAKFRKVKLRNGLFKISDTRNKVEAISVELEEAKKKVAKFQKQCEEYLVIIAQQKREADEQQGGHTIRRKRRAAAILTDTPVERALEEEKTAKLKVRQTNINKKGSKRADKNHTD